MIFVFLIFQFLQEHENKKVNVFVMTMKGYLDTFWSHLSGIEDLFESLTAAKEESVSKGRCVKLLACNYTEFTGYLFCMFKDVMP